MTDMEKTIPEGEKIDDKEEALTRAIERLQRVVGLNKRLSEIEERIEALNRKTDVQQMAVESLSSSLSQGTVPVEVHQRSLSKINELEENMRETVTRSEHAALQRRYDEAARQIIGMIPSADYHALKERVKELEGVFSSMVPREQLESSQERVMELEASLEGRVSQSAYDEIVSKVVHLAEEVTGGEASATEERGTKEEVKLSELGQPSGKEPVHPGENLLINAQSPMEEKAGAEEAVAAEPSPGTQSGGNSPEITEVGSQLAEMTTEAVTVRKPVEGFHAKMVVAGGKPEVVPTAVGSSTDAGHQGIHVGGSTTG